MALLNYKVPTSENRSYLRVISCTPESESVKKKFDIKSKIMRKLDSWADSISQRTFNRIMYTIFAIVVIGCILITGHLEYTDISNP